MLSGEDFSSLRYKGTFIDSATYKKYTCSQFLFENFGKAYSDPPYGVAITMGFTVRMFDHINYEQLDSFNVHFTAASGSTPDLVANIYSASAFNFNGKYQSDCRMRNFRRDIHFGPVSWAAGSWTDGNVYSTPNLIKIIRPLLDRGTLIWRKYFFLIFEWVARPGNSVNLKLRTRPFPYYTFHYKDTKPGSHIECYTFVSGKK